MTEIRGPAEPAQANDPTQLDSESVETAELPTNENEKEQTPMLDIHPAHHAASTWREFFIHIATIVLGLLIAISFEQLVAIATPSTHI